MGVVRGVCCVVVSSESDMCFCNKITELCLLTVEQCGVRD